MLQNNGMTHDATIFMQNVPSYSTVFKEFLHTVFLRDQDSTLNRNNEFIIPVFFINHTTLYYYAVCTLYYLSFYVTVRPGMAQSLQ